MYSSCLICIIIKNRPFILIKENIIVRNTLLIKKYIHTKIVIAKHDYLTTINRYNGTLGELLLLKLVVFLAGYT